MYYCFAQVFFSRYRFPTTVLLSIFTRHSKEIGGARFDAGDVPTFWILLTICSAMSGQKHLDGIDKLQYCKAQCKGKGREMARVTKEKMTGLHLGLDRILHSRLTGYQSSWPSKALLKIQPPCTHILPTELCYRRIDPLFFTFLEFDRTKVKTHCSR